jgi:hypothetical protein
MFPQWSQQLISLVFFALICIRQEGGKYQINTKERSINTNMRNNNKGLG